MGFNNTSNAVGRHVPNNGEGLTAQDLYELLRVMTLTERRKSYVTAGPFDVIGLSIGQSDQAERCELSVHIVLDGKGNDLLYES